MMMGMRYAGIDGCRGGWVAVTIDGADRLDCNVYNNIHDVWADAVDARAVLVDMPIGLPWSQHPERQADLLARRAIGPRRSSVFPCPVRNAVYADDYERAGMITREQVGKGLSKQAYMITPKIRELDGLLTGDEAARSVFYEAHPEVAFRFAAGRDLEWNKKDAFGFVERLRILERIHEGAEAFLRSAVRRFSKKTVALDDVVDALVLALSARASGGRLSSFPEAPPRDEKGLAMAIWYHDFNGAG